MILAQIVTNIPPSTMSDALRLIHDVCPTLTGQQDIDIVFGLVIVARIGRKYFFKSPSSLATFLSHLALELSIQDYQPSQSSSLQQTLNKQ